MKKKEKIILEQNLIEIKNPDNDYVVTEGKSKKILARAPTYDGAREKAILLHLKWPTINRLKYHKVGKNFWTYQRAL
jgi:hypothetical protein